MLARIIAFLPRLYPIFLIISVTCNMILAVVRYNLLDKIEDIKDELSRAIRENTNLKESLVIQNSEIIKLERETNEAKVRYDAAKFESEQKNKTLEEQVKALKNAKGKDCNDAMNLVNDVLK